MGIAIDLIVPLSYRNPVTLHSAEGHLGSHMTNVPINLKTQRGASAPPPAVRGLLRLNAGQLPLRDALRNEN